MVGASPRDGESLRGHGDDPVWMLRSGGRPADHRRSRWSARRATAPSRLQTSRWPRRLREGARSPRGGCRRGRTGIRGRRGNCRGAPRPAIWRGGRRRPGSGGRWIVSPSSCLRRHCSSIPNSAPMRAYRLCSACTARAIAGSVYTSTADSASPTARALSRMRRFAAIRSSTSGHAFPPVRFVHLQDTRTKRTAGRDYR